MSFPTSTAPIVTDEKSLPILGEKQSIVCSINPTKFDALTKILNVLDEQNVIIIDNSAINQSVNKGTAILTADVSELIGQKISLHILQPKKYLRLFKQIKGNGDVFIIDDPENERYIITNQDISLFLPKQLEKLTEENSPPDLSNAEVIGSAITCDKEERNTIISFGREAKNIDLLIKENQLKAVSIPELAVIKFKSFIKESIDDTTADIKLRTSSFLAVDGEEYKIHLGKIEEQYWTVIHVNTGMINISILEAVDPVSDKNLLI